MTPPKSDPAMARVSALESSLRAAGVRGANDLTELLSLVAPSQPAAVRAAAAHAVRRSLPQLAPHCGAAPLDGWLRARRDEYGARLAGALGADARTDAALLACGAAAGPAGARAVASAAICGGQAGVLAGAAGRSKVLRVAALICVVEGEGGVSERVSVCRAAGMALSEGAEARKERKLFGEAWMAVLGDEAMDEARMAEVLAFLAQEVVPVVPNPLRLADFLTRAYDGAEGERIPIAALDALFVLVSRHGLDYPSFYPRLYALLTPYALFEAPERAKFLALAALFLTRGSYLPGGMVAAFIKRLARRALVAPPEGALWCLRLALELLRKHPSTSFLVHRTVDLFSASASKGVGSDESAEGGVDPFDDDVKDPQDSGAERSSLWELQALEKHASPAVSRLVDAFSKDVRKRPPPPPGDLEDYAGLDFSDMFCSEFKRKAKSTPLAYCSPADPSANATDVELASVLRWT